MLAHGHSLNGFLCHHFFISTHHTRRLSLALSHSQSLWSPTLKNPVSTPVAETLWWPYRQQSAPSPSPHHCDEFSESEGSENRLSGEIGLLSFNEDEAFDQHEDGEREQDEEETDNEGGGGVSEQAKIELLIRELAMKNIESRKSTSGNGESSNHGSKVESERRREDDAAKTETTARAAANL
jgi:hypothetical protein